MPGTDSERKDDVARITMLEARDRMTEVVERAIGGEPQVITRYGRDSVVVIAVKEFERLRGRPLEASAA
jgi:prevent-host-death family protein